MAAGSGEGRQCRGQPHRGTFDVLAGNLAHHLPHLQDHKAVEGAHADGSVLLAAQLHGGADVGDVVVVAVARGLLGAGLIAQEADEEAGGVGLDAFEEGLELVVLQELMSVLVCSYAG